MQSTGNVKGIPRYSYNIYGFKPTVVAKIIDEVFCSCSLLHSSIGLEERWCSYKSIHFKNVCYENIHRSYFDRKNRQMEHIWGVYGLESQIVKIHK